LLAGDLLALNLNVIFDQVFPSFGAADLNLTALVLVKGPCAGLSVGAVLDIASDLLSGCAPASFVNRVSLYTAATIDACVASINTNFLGGAYVGAFLALPGFNLQANANIKLPVISATVNAAVKASILSSISARALLQIALSGIDVNANVALALKNGVYNAWKLDLNARLALDVALKVKALVLTSLSASITGGVALDASLDLDVMAYINFILNFHAGVHAKVNVQIAILKLLNPSLSLTAIINATGLTGCNTKLIAAIVADAQLNGKGFVPAPNQIVGVVAKVEVSAGVFANVLLEIKVPTLDINISSNLCIDL